jgi:hypothetical protein
MRTHRYVKWTKQAPRIALAVALTAFPACADREKIPTLSAEQSVAVTNGARNFLANVAGDVTKRGPLAWLDHFDDTPVFFMAADGRLAFSDGMAAMRGIKELPGKIAHIELRWEEPIRVDPLTPTLVMVAMGWQETIVDPAGHKVEQAGYFTGLAELGSAGWKFRDAHWSVATSPSSTR